MGQRDVLDDFLREKAENGDAENITIQELKQMAEAMGCTLQISFRFRHDETLPQNNE